MIRITVITETEEEVVVKVEGRVEAEGVEILEQEGERYLQQDKRLVLDLAGVQFINDAGIWLLQRWSGDRLVLRGASWFLQGLLEVHRLA